MQLKYVCVVFILLAMWSCSEAVIEDEDTEPILEIVSYNPDIKALVDNFCINCHNASAASGGLDLSTYDLVRNSTENGNLILRINDVNNPMPQSGLMPAAERDLFDKWVEDGFPENEDE